MRLVQILTIARQKKKWFYAIDYVTGQLWREKGMLQSQALVEAQKELRGQEKFQHPFYWAAFYMTGV